MSRRRSRRLLVLVLAGVAGRAAADAVRRHHPGGAERWERSNYRQQQVDLAGGPGALAGLLAGLGAAGLPAAVTATAAAGGLGLYDDLAGHTHARGLRGHVAALRRGVVTTGMVKMLGLAAAGALAGPSRPRRVVATAVDVALVAGTANLVNLLDLRPGRALKVVLAASAPFLAASGPAGDAAAATATVAVVLLPADLGEQLMIGDCGANALGAALGWTMAGRLGRAGRAAAACAVVGLTVLSERVSFTELIQRVPALAAIDGWGRRAS